MKVIMLIMKLIIISIFIGKDYKEEISNKIIQYIKLSIGFLNIELR